MYSGLMIVTLNKVTLMVVTLTTVPLTIVTQTIVTLNKLTLIILTLMIVTLTIVTLMVIMLLIMTKPTLSTGMDGHARHKFQNEPIIWRQPHGRSAAQVREMGLGACAAVGKRKKSVSLRLKTRSLKNYPEYARTWLGQFYCTPLTKIYIAFNLISL